MVLLQNIIYLIPLVISIILIPLYYMLSQLQMYVLKDKSQMKGFDFFLCGAFITDMRSLRKNPKYQNLKEKNLSIFEDENKLIDNEL